MELDPLGIGLAAQGTQALLGAIQTGIGAAKMRKLERPEYSIPDEIRQNLTQAQIQAYEGLPAEQKQQYLQNIQRSQATAMKGLSSRKAGLTGITDMLQSQNDAFTNLVSMDASARQQNRILARQEAANMAAYKDKAFDMNKMQPYQDAAEEAQALIGSGIQNIGGAAANTAMMSMYSNLTDKVVKTPTDNTPYNWQTKMPRFLQNDWKTRIRLNQ